MLDVVVLTRTYPSAPHTPDAGAAFAGAAILAALGQQDWQLSDDVAEASRHLLIGCCDPPSPGVRVSLSVSVDSAGACVSASNDAGWARDVVVRPRRHIRSVPRRPAARPDLDRPTAAPIVPSPEAGTS